MSFVKCYYQVVFYAVYVDYVDYVDSFVDNYFASFVDDILDAVAVVVAVKTVDFAL
jgi:lysyl-tRNA synthetase class II